jgi:sugar O-acyltransferase (sialic acid O-acetyltransferase NeuD family)
MRALYGVYGASGCGRGVLPLLRDQLAARAERDCALVFVDDGLAGATVNGHLVLAFSDFAEAAAAEKRVCVAIADGQIRRRLALRCEEAGIGFVEVRSPHVVVMDDVEIGPGAILSPFVTLTSNIRIGRHFHANLHSYVEHDCVIGDFVTFAPGAKCNGNVRIEDHAYVGSGAVIRQGKPGSPLVIGKGALVGMGAVVTKDVAPGAVVIGNPARLI